MATSHKFIHGVTASKRHEEATRALVQSYWLPRMRCSQNLREAGSREEALMKAINGNLRCNSSPLTQFFLKSNT